MEQDADPSGTELSGQTKNIGIRLLIAGLITVIALYEFSFRIITKKWGEVDMNVRPVTLYYSLDMIVPGKPLQWLFYPRMAIPLGKVEIAAKDISYERGKFYIRDESGGWVDLDEKIDKWDETNTRWLEEQRREGGQ